MDINISLKVDGDDSVDSLKYDIIHAAAEQILNEVMRNQDHYGRSFKDKLREEVRNILKEEMGTDFKDEVTSLVSRDLQKKYERTKQYKEIQKELDIKSDAFVKSELAKMIGEIARNEIKSMLK